MRCQRRSKSHCAWSASYLLMSILISVISSHRLYSPMRHLHTFLPTQDQLQPSLTCDLCIQRLSKCEGDIWTVGIRRHKRFYR